MKNENLVIKPKRPKGEDGYKVFWVWKISGMESKKR